MKVEYKVIFFMDNTYQVIEIKSIYGKKSDTIEEEMVFQGGLSDCEAYIRLKKSGYL